VTQPTEVARGGAVYRLARRSAPAGFALPADFWSRFYQENWETRGAVIERPFAAPLAAPAETFDWLVTAGDRFRAGDRRVSIEFCIEHAQQLADVGRYLPEHSDGSADGYAERVTKLVGGRKFGLVVDDFQAFDATLWLRVREFLRGLFEHTGLPGETAKATIFLGNYDSTPFGLHRGRSGNFMYVVDGRKRMRTWPDAFFRGKEDLTNRLDYQHYNDDSIVLDADPGDVIYWPSDYWHIGESVDGQLSAAVSIALFMDHVASADLQSEARGMVAQRLARNPPAKPFVVYPSRIGESVGAIAEVVSRATAALREVSQDPGLDLRLHAAWLNHVTGSGFTTVPSPLPMDHLDDQAVVRGRPEYPIIWMHTDDEDLICSVNGHAFSLTASPSNVALLERLNRGDRHRVDRLVTDHSGPSEADGVQFETTPADVRALLEKLVSLRAISVEARNTSAS
jgi:50S ribosomal protein L16 3-hydroxylase